MKWKRLLPLQEKRLVPSGIRPLPCVILQREGGEEEWFYNEVVGVKEDAKVLPDLLTQVGFGVFAELAFSTLRDVQWNDCVP